MSRPKPTSLPDPALRRAIESLAAGIPDPGAKLRFIQHAIEVYGRQPELLRRTSSLKPIAVRLACYGALEDLGAEPKVVSASKPADISWALYKFRHAVLALAILALASLAYAYGPTGFRAARQGVETAVQLLPSFSPATSSASRVASRDRAARLANEPPARVTKPPEQVWLVEDGPLGELWSNGLRIFTSYHISTEKRRYVVFPKDGGDPVLVTDKPAGIVYHTSESDIAPFEPDATDSLLSNTRGLLRWLRQHGSYHYLIDRFGRIYRLVEESDVAYHAGKSIWADDDYYYLDLNDSFIGICFESEWRPQASDAEIVTPAQIQAAMNLTDMLRARYGISDTNSVPHGLISVNPAKMLIGHHIDWARGFPFAALGLSDKYEVPLPSILGFGFSSDEDLVKRMGGKLWPGVEHAERELRIRSQDRGVPSVMLRTELRRAYLRHQQLLENARKNGYQSPAMTAGS